MKEKFEESQIHLQEEQTTNQIYKMYLGVLFPNDTHNFHSHKGLTHCVEIHEAWHQEEHVENWIAEFNSNRKKGQRLMEYNVIIPQGAEPEQPKYIGKSIIGYSYDLPNYSDEIDRIAFMNFVDFENLHETGEEILDNIARIGPFTEGLGSYAFKDLLFLPWSSYLPMDPDKMAGQIVDAIKNEEKK